LRVSDLFCHDFWSPGILGSWMRELGCPDGSGDDGEDLVLAEDDEILLVDADLAAGVLADEDLVALLDVDRRALALVVDLAGTDGDDLGLLRLFLGGVGDDDSAAHLL